jgi:large subunit ribosomal protein L35
MKTNKAMASRFKVTGSGKLVRQHPGRRHKLTKKSSAHKRALANPALVDESQSAMYKRLICAK